MLCRIHVARDLAQLSATISTGLRRLSSMQSFRVVEHDQVCCCVEEASIRVDVVLRLVVSCYAKVGSQTITQASACLRAFQFMKDDTIAAWATAMRVRSSVSRAIYVPRPLAYWRAHMFAWMKVDKTSCVGA